MRRLLLLYRSLVGKKAIVAVTGAVLLGFVVLHVVGNLKAFLPDAASGVPDIDLYSRFLRTMGEPVLPHAGALWLLRCLLLAALTLHVVCVFQLAARNRRARPVDYDRYDHARATASGRWMLVTGSLLFVFVVFHLLHFTTGTIDPDRFVHGAVYENLRRAFVRGPFVAVYLGALAVLALHLYHGTWSLFQTLGLDNPDRNRGLRRVAIVVAVIVPLAFASVPVAFFSGGMKGPELPANTTIGSR